MSSDYAGALARLKSLLAAHVPDRKVSRTKRDFADIPDGDLTAGVFTILPRGIEGYDYEASNHFNVDPAQTELGEFAFVITGQTRVPENAAGETVDDAEFAMIAELESFADTGITDENLKDLLLRRTAMSQQQEAPYAWVFTEWRLRLFD